MVSLETMAKMDARNEELSKLQSYVEGIDNELTMILQSLQWDRKSLTEYTRMVKCKHDIGHRIPANRKEVHERECFLRQEGYSKEDKLLPDPFDPTAETLIKLNNDDIKRIIIEASKSDPLFKIGWGCHSRVPAQTLERLQAAYTADERSAVHAAVVNAAPACHDLADLALPSTNGEGEKGTARSRQEILAELRDVRRRRAKYRVAGKARNYSDVLRGVISSQMEILTNPNTNNESEVTKSEVKDKRQSTVTTTKKNASSFSTKQKNIKNETKIDERRFENKTIQRKAYKERSQREDSKVRYNRESSRERARNSSRERSKRKSSQERHERDHASDRYRRDSSRERYRKDSSRERHRRDSSGQPRRNNDDPNNRRYKNMHQSPQSKNKDGPQTGRYNSRAERRNQWYNNKQNMKYDRQDCRNNIDTYRNAEDYSGNYVGDYGDNHSGNHSSSKDVYKNVKRRSSTYKSEEMNFKGKKRCHYDSDSSRSDNRTYRRSRSSSSRRVSRSKKRKKKGYDREKETKTGFVDKKKGEAVQIKKERSASHSSGSSSSSSHTKRSRSSWE